MLGNHFLTLLRICPIIPVFGTMYAALTFRDNPMVAQALSLISMAQRAARVPSVSMDMLKWGYSWMSVLAQHWPRLLHVALGDMGNMLAQAVPGCDPSRAAYIHFFHIWTHADPTTPLIDQVCGANLGIVPYAKALQDPWQRALQSPFASRPRLLLVDRWIGAHWADVEDELSSRVATGYGVDSSLLDLLNAPSSCSIVRDPAHACCLQGHRALASLRSRQDCEDFCCEHKECWGCVQNHSSWTALPSCFSLRGLCSSSQKLPSSPWGYWLEFGVFFGATLRSTAIHLMRTGFARHPVYGFDSFRGLDEDWGRFDRFEFSTAGRIPKYLPPNAKLVVGWYNKTLPAFIRSHLLGGGKVQWLHLDCDTYAGHRLVLSLLSPFLMPGSVLIFDDILNYAGYEGYALQAFYEFIQETGWSFEVLVAPWRVEWSITTKTPSARSSLPWWLSRMRAIAVRLVSQQNGAHLERKWKQAMVPLIARGVAAKPQARAATTNAREGWALCLFGSWGTPEHGVQHLVPAMASSSQNTGSGTRLGRRVRACLLSGELLEVELSPGSGAEEVRSQVAQRLGRHRFEVALLQDGKKLQDCDPVLGDVSVLVQPFLSQDVIDELIHNMRAAGVAFSEGMTDEEVRQAEENCKIRFPPDLKLFLQTAMPEGPEFPNWRRTVAVSVHDHHAVMRDDIHARLGGVQSFWYTEWGPRPEDRTERASLTARHLKGVPRLIPVYRHHFVVSGTPAGQPVLGVADPCRMCLLATDLAAYFSLIFNFRPVRPYLNCPVVTATFWGEIEKHLFHHQTVMSGLWG
ncbi:unnamed protein product [Symbiodinium microadriaticum]|nr:unnamed protein product [Symbiodinium microadriaticum]CAE7944486.1 unnamed protein product [Symbiodinium sp. KB8]